MDNQEQIISKKLDFNYWFVTHKILLRKILVSFILLVDFALFAYIAYVLIFNLVFAGKDYQALLQNLASNNFDYQSLRSAALPQGIQVVNLQVYPNNDNFDLMAEIANPALKWWATFDYQFKIGQEYTDSRKGFILPGERKKVFDLNIENGDAVSNLIIQNIVWHKELNFNNLVRERYLFDLQNITYIPAQELGVGDKIAISRVVFEITNNSAFSYKNVNLFVTLLSGDQIVGINQLTSGSLQSKQTKKLEVTFFQALPRVTNVEIVPEINILDKDSYL